MAIGYLKKLTTQRSSFMRTEEEKINIPNANHAPFIFGDTLLPSSDLTMYDEATQKILDIPEATTQALSFCPRYLGRYLCCDGPIIAALLLVDISGFTKLSSSLCTQGPSGIDLLRKITGNSLSQFVECVYLHGGDVIEFAGDSVLCVFYCGSQKIQQSCLQAVNCGLNLSKFHIDGTHTHVAVSCGEVTISLVGGYRDQQCHLLNSLALEHLDPCLTLAGKEELVITSEVFHHVKSEFETSAVQVVDKNGKDCYKLIVERNTWTILPRRRASMETPNIQSIQQPPKCFNSTRNGNGNGNGLDSNESIHSNDSLPLYAHNTTSSSAVISLTSTHASGLPNFTEISNSLTINEKIKIINCIPTPVIHAILTNSLSGLSELRTVTTLFLKLDSFHYQTFHNNSDLLHLFLMNMQKCLYECGGMLRQFLIDDKGCVLIGLWGVPTASHAANCSKALRCAVLMQNSCQKLGYQISIGISTGSVFCGLVGTTYRRDYVAIGRSVNLAARLMTKANGKIYLDDDTFRRLPLNVACYTYLTEPLEMKGIPSGSKFHCFWSKTLTRSNSDMSADHLLIIESYLRKAIHQFIELEVKEERDEDGEGDGDGEGKKRKSMIKNEIIPSIPDISTALSSISSPRSPPNVFIIRGINGSGKSTLANYMIRKILESTKSKSVVAPLYLSLISDDDLTPYSTIRKIIEALLAWTTRVDPISQWEFFCERLFTTFPSYTKQIIFKYIYPQFKEALNLTWEMIPLEGQQEDGEGDGRGEGKGKEKEKDDSCPLSISNTSLQDLLAQFLYHLLGHVIPVLAIDDAHFMCTQSWNVITKLSQLGTTTKIILTLRVYESGSVVSSEDIVQYQQAQASSIDYDTSLVELSHSANVRLLYTPMGDIPIRHCTEYILFCKQVNIQQINEIILHPITKKSIRRILEAELEIETIPNKTVEIVHAISHGNPYLIWQIIDYVNETGSNNVEEAMFNMKDNSFIVSLLEKLPQSHCAIIKIASVIGEEFSSDLLESLLPPELTRHLHEALQNLDNRGLLVCLSEGFNSFSSSLVRKFVYDLIPPSEAKGFHRLIAHQIETRYAHNLTPYRSMLCYHYSMSGVPHLIQTAVEISCQLIIEYMTRREIESALPFLAFALNHSTSCSQYRHLRQLIVESIQILQQSQSIRIVNKSVTLIEHTITKLNEMLYITTQHDNIISLIKYKIHSLYHNCLYSSSSHYKQLKKSRVVPHDHSDEE